MEFSADERARLLAVKGVGPVVVGRLEQAGFESFKALATADMDSTVEQIAAMLGTTYWKNSPQARAAIADAIAAACAAAQPPKRSKKN